MRLSVLVLVLMSLGACSSGGRYYQDDGPPRTVPPEVLNTPDAVPRSEPPGAKGNKPYTALGNTYYPLSSARGYVATGSASWYGTKYHGQTTSSGEIYDMYKMTAAHPTLPLPSYVRVTNLQSRKSVVVRVNDRGPFLNNRIIDVSYAAAARLGILATGTGQVEVKTVFPEAVPGSVTTSTTTATGTGPYPPGLVSSAIIEAPLNDEGMSDPAPVPGQAASEGPVGSSLEDGGIDGADPRTFADGAPRAYLQVGVFSQAANADSLLQSLRSRGFSAASIWTREGTAGQTLYEVSVGPLTDRDKQHADSRLKELGYQPFLVIK